MPTDNISEHGTLWAYYKVDESTSFKLCMGYVTKIGMSFSKNTSVVPIVTKSAEDAFPLDNGVTKTYTFNGSRKQPSTISDVGNGIYPNSKPENEIRAEQAAWSCETWFTKAMGLVDRWQMKTDGCWFKFVPEDDNPYISIGSSGIIHGYIGSIEITYNREYNELLTFYLSVTIGTMHVIADDDVADPPMFDYLENAPAKEYVTTGATPRRVAGSYITISSSDRNNTYMIGNLNDTRAAAVESYTLTGGPSEPFEHIEMTCSVNRLKSVAPALVKGMTEWVGPSESSNMSTDLIGKKNLISVHAVGTSTFVLTNSVKPDSSTTKVKLRGYCQAYAYKDASFKIDTTPGTPYEVIDMILSDAQYGPLFTQNRRIMNFDPEQRGSGATIQFKKGQNIWYALQVCSTILGCKIFFANDKAYLIDYRVPKDDATYPTGDDWSANEIYTYHDRTGNRCAIDIYPFDDTLGTTKDFLFARTLSSSFGGGGSDAITEEVAINYKGDDGSIQNDVITDPVVQAARSEDVGYSFKSVTFNIDELRKGSSGSVSTEDFALPYLEYMREPQTSIKFKVKEGRDSDHGMEWRALFTTVAQADSITDCVKGMTVTNHSEYEGGIRRYQKLYLSSYSRHYPDMTSEYEWGIINEVDLSNRLSQGFQL